jgi:hypothetical protein
MKPRTKVLGLLAFLAGASAWGCSSLPAIRESAPVLVGKSATGPSRTAACVASEVTSAGPEVSILRPPWDPPVAEPMDDGYRVLVVEPGGSPLAEIRVTPAGSGSSVELRTRPSPAQDVLVDAVRRCLTTTGS